MAGGFLIPALYRWLDKNNSVRHRCGMSDAVNSLWGRKGGWSERYFAMFSLVDHFLTGDEINLKPAGFITVFHRIVRCVV